MAATRTNPRTNPQRSFDEEIKSVARRLYLSTPRISDEDRQFLKDVMRPEGRYPLRALERLTEIAKQSTRAEHREALADVIRYRSTPCISITVTIAFDRETESNGMFDIAQRVFEQQPTRANLERLEEAGQLQIATTRESIDAARRMVLM